MLRCRLASFRFRSLNVLLFNAAAKKKEHLCNLPINRYLSSGPTSKASSPLYAANPYPPPLARNRTRWHSPRSVSASRTWATVRIPVEIISFSNAMYHSSCKPPFLPSANSTGPGPARASCHTSLPTLAILSPRTFGPSRADSKLRGPHLSSGTTLQCRAS